jgi:hypothetical protein
VGKWSHLQNANHTKVVMPDFRTWFILRQNPGTLSAETETTTDESLCVWYLCPRLEVVYNGSLSDVGFWFTSVSFAPIFVDNADNKQPPDEYLTENRQ